MIATMSTIATFTAYFFLKVVRTPHKSERDQLLERKE
jgi:hypothetical protein